MFGVCARTIRTKDKEQLNLLFDSFRFCSFRIIFFAHPHCCCVAYTLMLKDEGESMVINRIGVGASFSLSPSLALSFHFSVYLRTIEPERRVRVCVCLLKASAFPNCILIHRGFAFGLCWMNNDCRLNCVR